MRRLAFDVLFVVLVVICANPSAASTTHAFWAERLVDSIGVNVHLHYDETPYVQQWEDVRSVLVQSRIRHVRDSLIDTTWKPYYAHLNELGQNGIDVTLVASLSATPALLADYPRRVRRIAAYEGLNETNGTPVAAVRTVQRRVWSAAKALPVPLPVIGPSLTSPEAVAAAGNLEQVQDFGNMHDYLGGRNPETPGWGAPGFGSRYGSVAYNIGAARQSGESKPVIATETGYSDDTSFPASVPEVVAGIYTPRVVLVHLAAGVPRTFFYELVDEGLDFQGHFGLLRSDLTPKPAFRALEAMIALLSDPGPPVPQSDVDIDLESGGSDVQSLVLTKHDHTLIVALWRPLPRYDVDERMFTPVQAADVLLRVGGVTPSYATARAFDDRGMLVARAVSVSGDRVRLSVDDHVVFVTFPSRVVRPGGSTHHD
jgi:hypothetical protein